MYLCVYVLLVTSMTGLGLGENDVKCKAVGFQCDKDKKKVEFCRKINADPEPIEVCEGDRVCQQENNNVRCTDPGNQHMKFMCTGKGEFPDTKNCSRTYICSSEGEEPSEVCTCPSGASVYPIPGLFCMPGKCPRENVTCTEGAHGFFTLTTGQRTSYYYYCLSSDTVLVYDNAEVRLSEEFTEEVALRLRIMENNGKKCIPHIRSSLLPTESTTPGSSTPTTTGSTTPGSSTPTTTESTTPGSSTPTTTESTTPGSSTPTTTGSTTPGSSTPTTTGSTTPGSSTPKTTGSTTPGSSTPTTTESTTPGSSTPTTTESTTPGSSTPTTTGSTTPGSSTPTTTESTTPDSTTLKSTESTTPTSTPVPPEEKPTCRHKAELHETECDCDYYKCDSNLKPIRRTCKDGLKYHAKLKKCVFGECDETKCIHRAPKFIF